MNCRDFKIQLLENAESGAESLLSDQMSLHCRGCAACQTFCEDVKAQYAALHEEKNASPNPFLAQKIIYRVKEKENTLKVAIPAFKKFVLYPAVICLGLFTGFALNYFTVDETDAADDLVAETTGQVISDDGGGENDILNLNE